MPERQHLFSRNDLSAVLSARLDSIRGAVLAIQQRDFEGKSDEEITANIVKNLRVESIVLLEDEISVSSNEIMVDRRDWFEPGFRGGSGQVPGVAVTYHVPFTGERDLFDYRPNTYTLSPPVATVSRSELLFRYEVPGREITSTKPEFEKELENVKKWLVHVSKQVEQFNNSLPGTAGDIVGRRRSELAKTAEDLSSLGYRVRRPGE